MLQSVKNKQTLSILKRLRSQGAPQVGGIEPISPLGEAEAGEEDVIDQDTDVDQNAYGTEVRSPLFSKKKKKKLMGLAGESEEV